ncbi:hypothetical protein CALCODRAFT_480472 [Calocera cornea HHB12733]|uniref:Uncharacterized protein n=1 Tax=Calocera cornea HHB12733 TaxID=1353952 RepID=A0A165IP28_9BASI|nr:hypothetical protein CALCODRAFT_480472 [Calocera cornea HHB12733]
MTRRRYNKYLSQPLPGCPGWDWEASGPPPAGYASYPCPPGTVYVPAQFDLGTGPPGYWYDDPIHGKLTYLPVSQDRWYEVHPTPLVKEAVVAEVDCDCACHDLDCSQGACRWMCACRAAIEASRSSCVPTPPCRDGFPVSNPWYAKDAVSIGIRTPPVGERVNVYIGLGSDESKGLPDEWQRPIRTQAEWNAAQYAYEMWQANDYLNKQGEHRTATDMALLNSRALLDKLLPRERSLWQGTEPALTDEQRAIIRETGQSVRQAVEQGFSAALAANQPSSEPAAPAGQATMFTPREQEVVSSDPTVIYVYGGPPSGWIRRSLFANLSPSSHHPVSYKDKAYNTATHLWHALRFEEVGDEYMERVRSSSNPKKTANELWKLLENVGHAEIDIRYKANLSIALRQKYEQYPELKDQLLETGRHSLVDPLDDDDTVGKILETIRRELYEETYGA